ncbi:unnamed protein product [Haemonchus placei]|uniref:Uncharacterized protein n=1 Tax=Haemonchus placei TaxID=6290 RepID=A0A0N4WGC0_HAEPC|nr:unnamed protein product [Haemonchus placei]
MSFVDRASPPIPNGDTTTPRVDRASSPVNHNVDRVSSSIPNGDTTTPRVDRASSPVNIFAKDVMGTLQEYAERLALAIVTIHNLEGRNAECMRAA